MNKLIGYAACAVGGAVVGYAVGTLLRSKMPDKISINIPYGPKFSYTASKK